LTEEEKAEGEIIAQSGGLPRDPTKKREMKIRQYRREKELKEQVSVRCDHHTV
jgi:immunoglobulin-binding protein 1